MTSTPDQHARTTYHSVFAGREIKVLFGTVLLYGLGFSFEILGLAVLVYAKTESPFWSALAFGIGFLPQLFGGALLTSVADRFSPRTVIAIGLLVRAAPGVAIGLAPGMPVGVMLLVVGAAATVAPIFTAAASGLLPDLLDGDRYVVGRSLLTVISSGTQILGLGLGGAVLALVPAPDLVLAAGGALAAAALVARLGLRRRAAHTTEGTAGSDNSGGVVRTTLAGNHALLADRRVRNLLLAQWLPACCIAGGESLVVPYVGRLGQGESAANAVLAALPIGMLAGDLVLGRFCRAPTRERLAFPLAVLLGLPLLAFALDPPIVLAAVLLVASGAGVGYMLGIQQAFLDSVPKGLRGRAFGLLSTGMMGGQGVTPPVAGVLAVSLGVGIAIAVAGAAAVIAALALYGTLTGRGARD